MPGRNSVVSLIGLSGISKKVYAHIVWHMKEFTGKRPMRRDRGKTDIARPDPNHLCL
jgi:hypothetical protein